MRIKNVKFIPIILSLVLFINIVLAQTYPTHQFYGRVYYNGQPAPDGLSVVAKNSYGNVILSTKTQDGKYGYNPVFLVNGSTNDVIHFFVNGIDTGRSEPFCDSCFNDCGWVNDNCPPFDLSVSGPAITTTTTPSGVISGGENTGGTSGGTTTIPTTTIVITETIIQGCQEKWTCTKWSECVNGVQTRTCTDENNCGTDLYKPFESQPCGVEQIESQINPLTGLITLTTTQVIVGAITVALIVIIVLGWRIISRRKTIPIPTSV